MTTEIAIANRQGLALAADSAVTIGRRRVWKTANKLFSLSPHNDIAVMIYGGGDFIGFPWETVVKSFRTDIGQRQFETVGECAAALIEYLRGPTFKSELGETLSVYLVFFWHLEVAKKLLGKYRTKKDFKDELITCLHAGIKNFEDTPICLPNLTLEDFSARYKKVITEAATDVFDERITKVVLEKCIEFSFEVFRRQVGSSYETGLVVAGFGKKEYFPSIVTHAVDGKHKDVFRYWSIPDYSHDINPDTTSNAIIIPFGQDDIAVLFLEGIAASHLRWVERTVQSILAKKSEKLCNEYIKDAGVRRVEQRLQMKDDEEIIRLLKKEFQDYRDRTLIQKIMGVVASLPKEEMAAMAEALVELTSLRRKMDSPLESVGGPTDVAIISKGDGLIWVKRKHYFEMELNGDWPAPGSVDSHLS